jgi:hypothetical protein
MWAVIYTVVYLLHERTDEPQKQPLLSNTRTGLCKPFLGNGSINAYQYVTARSCVFYVVCATQQYNAVFSVGSVPKNCKRFQNSKYLYILTIDLLLSTEPNTWQIRPLVREGAPQKQNRNCQRLINIWSWAPDGRFVPGQTCRLTVGRNIRLRLRLRLDKSVQESSAECSVLYGSLWKKSQLQRCGSEEKIVCVTSEMCNSVRLGNG